MSILGMAQEILDGISITKQGWYTREADRGAVTYVIRDISDYISSDDIIAQKIV